VYIFIVLCRFIHAFHFQHFVSTTETQIYDKPNKISKHYDIEAFFSFRWSSLFVLSLLCVHILTYGENKIDITTLLATFSF